MTDGYSLVYQSSNAFTERNWVNLAYSSEARGSLLAAAAACWSGSEPSVLSPIETVPELLLYDF